jgi:hypothetical protein
VALHHQDYLKAFHTGKGQDVTFQRIDHSQRFELQTRQHTKLGLNAKDHLPDHLYIGGALLKFKGLDYILSFWVELCRKSPGRYQR